MKKSDSEMLKLQKEMTELALKVANNLDVDLDFSKDSIQNVEKILDTISKDYKKTKNDEGISGLALEFAAYIITVIEKHITVGNWERNHPEVGGETFPYYLSEDKIIFPYGWCLNRIIDGEKENVWKKFNKI